MRLTPYLLLLSLAACDAPETVATQATSMKDSAYQSAGELKDWFLTPPVHKEALNVPSTYCYRAFGDVLCYRQPMPGWEDRFIGYQGTNAVSPPPAVTQPLVLNDTDNNKLMANRVSNAQPIFVGIPTDVKDTPLPASVKVSADPADISHQTLPNPALSPQL